MDTGREEKRDHATNSVSSSIRLQTCFIGGPGGSLGDGLLGLYWETGVSEDVRNRTRVTSEETARNTGRGVEKDTTSGDYQLCVLVKTNEEEGKICKGEHL